MLGFPAISHNSSGRSSLVSMKLSSAASNICLNAMGFMLCGSSARVTIAVHANIEFRIASCTVFIISALTWLGAPSLVIIHSTLLDWIISLIVSIYMIALLLSNVGSFVTAMLSHRFINLSSCDIPLTVRRRASSKPFDA